MRSRFFSLVIGYMFFSVALLAQDTPRVIHLWPNGAPGYENRRNEPEEAKEYWVKNIQNPSITVYFPAVGFFLRGKYRNSDFTQYFGSLRRFSYPGATNRRSKRVLGEEYPESFHYGFLFSPKEKANGAAVFTPRIYTQPPPGHTAGRAVGFFFSGENRNRDSGYFSPNTFAFRFVAPGYENRRNEPEEAKEYWVKNIQNASITVYFPPKEKANGEAVLICPGGGHRLLVYDAEGRDPALFLNSLGVTAIVLKYRLFREDSIYSMDKEVKQDVYRAMRLVRSHAAEWHIDTARVGIWGFSAGGEVVALVAYGPGRGDPKAADPVDRLNAKPDFQILTYPGPLGVPEKILADAPPAFLIAGNDDDCCSLAGGEPAGTLPAGKGFGRSAYHCTGKARF